MSPVDRIEGAQKDAHAIVPNKMLHDDGYRHANQAKGQMISPDVAYYCLQVRWDVTILYPPKDGFPNHLEHRRERADTNKDGQRIMVLASRPDSANSGRELE